MKPTMKVQEGDEVKLGQVLFECKKRPGLVFTSPTAGKILSIRRGEKRVFQVMELEVSEKQSQVKLNSYQNKKIEDLSREDIVDLLVESGTWTSFRTRPFSKIPAIDSKAHSIFVTAIDTNPLSCHPSLVLEGAMDFFISGIEVLTKLTDGKVHIVKDRKTFVQTPASSKIHIHEFSGLHPAGNVGTHIHLIDPVDSEKVVWHIGYQDIISLGILFSTGKIDTSRVISIAGPNAKEPKIIKTQMGACLCEALAGELRVEKNSRIISGSVFNGRTKSEVFCYLGRYHNQVTLLEEGNEREFLGWHSVSINKFSLKNIYFSKLFPKRKLKFNTSTNGSLRAIVPIGSYEQVMPLDILPVQLLRSLMAKDTDAAQELGALELDEEDLALCTFVSPSKIDYGVALRENLELIEKEG